MKTPTKLSQAELEEARRLVAELLLGESQGMNQVTSEYTELNRRIYKFTEGVGFEEMALLLPEEERPELIPFELPISTWRNGHQAYLVRPSLIPECAFIAQMHVSTGCSSKNVRIGRSAFRSNRSLTCFCDQSMNPENELGECLNVITELCSRYGIKIVIGRKANHEGPVRFMDTEQFEDLARKECNPDQMRKLTRLVWAE